MTIKNRLLVGVSAMLVSHFTMAAISPAATTLKQTLMGIEDYQASFDQQVTDSSGNLVQESTGTLTLARPNQLRWETHSPDESLLIADGESVWYIDPFAEQVTVMDQDNAIENNPVILLTSNDESTWEKFTVETAADTTNTYYIEPIENNGQVRRLTITFKDGNLVSLSTADAQAQTSKLHFSHIKVNAQPAPGLFKAQFDDSFIIDDQR
ncbi:outer membrane lipoprotein chaperone LolA [Alteromonas sp. C1M14]|uniref:outer membrane lipoprotein chaperone LolA n=1 Tax=Alteromonas sp. C1M14 TaxID=2841567 RepID=UPI001C0992EA|nr:outer membrane lipoprotein chaperone LolA [Alteromonas sp. C1M14]MBU2976821.1 outer membrane lipoprotein chaperone LolA [Alteromonas sp. C1M14]